MELDEELRRTCEQLLAAAPASVEMPAGAGKTHLLAAAVAVASESSQRCLVLTHTNAGVDAIRKRLKLFGVPNGLVRVETITSWAFSLVGAYPVIAGISVSDVPDWSQSDAYIAGATNVLQSLTGVDVHSVSFDYLFVDEYQDCTLTQHALVLSISAAVPRTVVLGDRLQAIFGFAGPLAEWATEVETSFAPFEIAPVPHRWKGHNEQLGDWLMSIRPQLADGNTIDFGAISVPGLSIVNDTRPTGVAGVAHGFSDFEQSVVLLDKWPGDVAGHASRLGGAYSVMEDISGNFMRAHLGGDPRNGIEALPIDGDPRIAEWLARFAKQCIIGLAEINGPVLGRLSGAQSLVGLNRAGLEDVMAALEALRVNPNYGKLVASAHVIRANATVRVYRWEAWNDTLKAIEMSAENGELPVLNLGRVRERLRRQGRRNGSRIASRTLLVKGLEYDHVVIANLSKMRDPRNLYVALSRARKSITIVASSPQVSLRDGA
ncbi:UvrD-helicase domain-containing protein [Chryseoglobus sp. 28M-23]|uniref:UvrD-helicase domain-containing protein n=1 Tax=Chryseoglobus sp. 28M-23 TaxID=2772253 RepID=UPI0017460652|nr:UvrD-helicase domain-containing protein [Chryseoglobus sp. 28M-23]QOD94086.1 AAA family ATPase [Chryseoglobus sp. 28M-23]